MKSALIQVVVLALAIFSSVRQSFGQLQYVHTTNLLAVADASLYSDLPDSLFGGVPFVVTGVYGGRTNRTLIRFDVSGLPTNATVENVALSLVSYSDPPTGMLFGLSLVLTNWDEYAVTWNDRSSPIPWTAPGGQAGTDFYPSPSALAMPSGTTGSTNQFTDNGSNLSFGLVHDVQSWVNNPAQNHGWMLAAANEGTANDDFLVSSHEQFGGGGPVLTVGFTQPFTPPILTGASITNGWFQFSFNVEPYHGYRIQCSGDLTGTNWATLRVLDPPPRPTTATDYELMTTSNRFYRVAY